MNEFLTPSVPTRTIGDLVVPDLPGLFPFLSDTEEHSIVLPTTIPSVSGGDGVAADAPAVAFNPNPDGTSTTTVNGVAVDHSEVGAVIATYLPQPETSTDSATDATERSLDSGGVSAQTLYLLSGSFIFSAIIVLLAGDF